jgi:ERCC4-related helicase
MSSCTDNYESTNRWKLHQIQKMEEEELDKILADPEFQAQLDRQLKEREAQLKKRPKIDPILEKNWIYPIDSNREIRDYQYEISKNALFKNTLVCLPTGLGKTFIASVVMYNYYRWFRTGKLIFVAPTTSLVTQQCKACCTSAPFNEKDVATLTGNIKPEKRTDLWNKCRVFFCTPQCVVKDLTSKRLPAEQIVLLVVDEAHRATANHDYCQIIKLLSERTTYYRVLGLTATPGKDLPTIQKVLINLNINHVEVRSEKDLREYTHEKKLIVEECPITEPIKELQAMFFQLVAYPIKILNQNRAYFETRLEEISYQALHHAMISFMSTDQTKSKYIVNTAFGIAISLYHAYSDLMTQGINVFINSLEKMENNQDHKSMNNRLRHSIFTQPLFQEIKRKARDLLQNQKHEHPKIVKLLEIIRHHFMENKKTRIIIFASKKQTVRYITQVLSKDPGNRIKAMEFLGQSKTGDVMGLSSKEQKEIIAKFTKGNYNTLVSTSVGEEGLDIGEVDMIICYDAVSSPIRMIQRMGRTGRKREGNAVMILTEGYEVNTYKRAIEKVDKLFEQMKMLPTSKDVKFFENCPRMISHDVEPECLKQNLNSDLSKHKNFVQSPEIKKNRKQPMISTTELKYLHNNYGRKYFPVAGRFYNYIASSLHRYTSLLTPFADIPHTDILKALISSSQLRCNPTYNWSTHKLNTLIIKPSNIILNVEDIKTKAEQEWEEEKQFLPITINNLSPLRNEDGRYFSNSNEYDGAHEFETLGGEETFGTQHDQVETIDYEQAFNSSSIINSSIIIEEKKDFIPDASVRDKDQNLHAAELMLSPIPNVHEFYSQDSLCNRDEIKEFNGLKHKNLEDLINDVFEGVMHPVFISRQMAQDCPKQQINSKTKQLEEEKQQISNYTTSLQAHQTVPSSSPTLEQSPSTSSAPFPTASTIIIKKKRKEMELSDPFEKISDTAKSVDIIVISEEESDTDTRQVWNPFAKRRKK